MKKNLYLLMALLFSCSLFFSCNDKDDDEEKEDEEEEVIQVNASYGGDSGNTLKLTYSGVELMGKEIKFYTSTKKTATVTLNYVIPGEATTELTGVILTTTPPKDDDDDEDEEEYESEYEYEYFFEGAEKTSTGWNITYTGHVFAEGDTRELTFDVEVTMQENILQGTWKLSENNTLFFDWQSDRETVIADVECSSTPGNVTSHTTETFSNLLARIGSQLVSNVLREVTFHTDGNITAIYTKAGSATELESPLNLVHYYLPNSSNDNKIAILLNADAIASLVMSNSSTRLSMQDILALVGSFPSLLQDGIPLDCEFVGDDLELYIGQEVAESILTEPAIVSLLDEKTFELDLMGNVVNLTIHGKELPALFEETTVFELGLSMQMK
ncbi:MAG: DUF4925 domain-containing protein [Bacteroides sp.]|nr:DUF4925 domain-containing protein [Bacteroides sp.]